MYKLVVLCAVIAAAVAEPSGLVAAPFVPLAYTSTIISPARTSISQQASSVVHPSPLLYSAPLTYGHYLKKRSVGFALPSTYIAPATYVAPAFAHAYAAPILKTPFLAPAPLAYTPAHFIKKRSVGFALPSTYYASTAYAGAPLITTGYSTPLLHSYPYVAPAPITYSHLIKKRSAPVLAAAYIAPTSYSSQSRVDIRHSTPLISTYSAPIAYHYVPGFSHIL